MMEAAIEWRATNLVALGEELRNKISRVTQQFEDRASIARSQDEASRLRQRLSQLVDSIQVSYRTQLERMTGEQESRDETLYDTTLAGIDMNRLVYRGDRKALAELLADAEFSSTVNQLLSDLKPYNARKDLLTKALKITRGMMGGLYQVTDHCARTLKLSAEIEVYVNQDSRFNAACYPPMKDKVLLFLTSSLLEKFTQQELAFVVGHELGHYLFEHTRFPVDYILQNHGGRLSPLHAMKLYAWIRNAEITADRVGMICCGDFDVAANTFFKLSSGITSALFQFNLKDYLAQLEDLRGEVSGQEADPQDWFSTHPFNPMRLKALEVFLQGQAYHQLTGKTGGRLTSEQVESQVEEMMKIMEPTYLQDTSDAGNKARRYLLAAGFLVVGANGVIVRPELQALSSVVGAQVPPDEIREMFNRSIPEVKEMVQGLSKDLSALMTGVQKLQLVRDLIVISYADGAVDEAEVNCLVWLCDNLGVDPRFIEQVLSSARRGVD
ncbi:MAG TPA: M48 family metalloprotease [Vicinamibacteria bacterium]|nr:M48 family metalloprotease [Vicinamibacteria bacterium]